MEETKGRSRERTLMPRRLSSIKGKLGVPTSKEKWPPCYDAPVDGSHVWFTPP